MSCDGKKDKKLECLNVIGPRHAVPVRLFCGTSQNWYCENWYHENITTLNCLIYSHERNNKYKLVAQVISNIKTKYSHTLFYPVLSNFTLLFSSSDQNANTLNTDLLSLDLKKYHSWIDLVQTTAVFPVLLDLWIHPSVHLTIHLYCLSIEIMGKLKPIPTAIQSSLWRLN